MPSLAYAVSIGSINQSKIRTGDDLIDLQVTLPAGKSGTLTTRTDDNTGIVTVASGHGITDSDTVDVYWAAGRRYGVDVTATDATTISIDLGAGDNLPTASTAVVICKQVVVNKAIDGDNVEIIGLLAELAASTGFGVRITFFDAVSGGGSAVGNGIDLDPNSPFVLDIEGGATNLLTGSPILSFVASNGDGSNACTLKIQGLQDVTP
jgi:hypothetical protein